MLIKGFQLDEDGHVERHGFFKNYAEMMDFVRDDLRVGPIASFYENGENASVTITAPSGENLTFDAVRALYELLPREDFHEKVSEPFLAAFENAVRGELEKNGVFRSRYYEFELKNP